MSEEIAVSSNSKKGTDLNEESTEAKCSTTEKLLFGTSIEQDSKHKDSVNKIEEKHPNSVQVVTGANFSGKSVYLKQIALIVYMAHVGR